jgi:hypothetical protein
MPGSVSATKWQCQGLAGAIATHGLWRLFSDSVSLWGLRPSSFLLETLGVMERSKALMIPMTSVSFESSGFRVTGTSDPNPGISSPIITRITATATLKERHPLRSSDKSSFNRPYCLPDSDFSSSLLFRLWKHLPYSIHPK